MKFTLTIELGNAAMRSYDDIERALDNVARSFRHIPRSVPEGADGRRIFDANGNTVGGWEITETPAEQAAAAEAAAKAEG